MSYKESNKDVAAENIFMQMQNLQGKKFLSEDDEYYSLQGKYYNTLL